MNWLRVSQTRVRAICRKRQIEAEIAAELRFHLEMRTRENIARGMGASEASLNARRQFGNLNSITDACRDVRGGGVLEVLWQDLRFAARMLLKDRAFTAVALLILALTIGANTAIFTVVSGVLLRPLPFHEPGQILSIWSSNADRQISRVLVSYPDFEDLRARNQWFDSLGAYAPADFILQSETGAAARAPGARFTTEMFPLLGVPAALGRTFLPGEDEPGSRTAVISHELWQRQWGGAASVIGAALQIDGREHRIVGVMPAGFRFPIQDHAPELWTTVATEREPLPGGGAARASLRRQRDWRLLGRLQATVSEGEARRGLTAVAAQLAVRHPDSNSWLTSCDVAPLLADLTGRVRPALLLLFGAALCVLAVGCANLSNLSLARASTRQKEFAIRSALGAGRSRILRQLLTESLLLAVIGGAMGLVAAFGLTRYIVAMLPPDFPRALEITPDVRVLFFTGLVTLATTCLFGFAPAWRSARADLTPLCNENSRESTSSVKGRRVRSALVACEIVLAFVLLAGAGLLLRGLWQLQNVPTGFDPKNLLTFRLSLGAYHDAEAPARVLHFYERLLERVGGIEGVESASLTSALPLIGRRWATDLELAARPTPAPRTPRHRFIACIVAPDYFRTMGIPLVRGRDFETQDRAGAPGVVIINETFARTHFPNQDALGKRITPRVSADGTGPIEREIIGVVGDVKFTDLSPDASNLGLFIPFAQCVAPEMRLIVRSEGALETILSGVRRVVADLEKNVALFEPDTMEGHLATVIAEPRLNFTLLAAYAAVAVLLTAIGVYGVTAYSVAQRRREIGLRLALGAPPRAVFRLIMREGIRILQWAIPVGALGTLLAMALLRDFVPEPGAIDVSIVPLVALLVAAIALAACWLPARRAMKIDPIVALRCE